MTRKQKASCLGGATGSIKQSQENHTKNQWHTQPPTVPGTALTAFLKRYRVELLACEFSREVSADLDCVDHLLDRVKTQGGC